MQAAKLSIQAGLTLLELLLVVTILSAVAFLSLSSVTDGTNQVRFEDTRNRAAAARNAVIGDVARTLNGSPEIRGFVADMGRLPTSFNELLTHEYCSDDSYLTQSDCNDASATWQQLTLYQYDSATGLWAGWNGPYIQTTQSQDDVDQSEQYGVFTDGWGNSDLTGNFGWIFTNDEDDTVDSDGDTDPANDNDHVLRVQSLGMNNAAGGSGYEADYPPTGMEFLVRQNDHRVLVTDSNTAAQNDEIGGIAVSFGSPPPCWRCTDNSHNNRSACETAGDTWYADTTVTDAANCVSPAAPNGDWEPSEELCLRVAYRNNGSINTMVSSGSAGNLAFTWNGSSKSARFSFEDVSTPYDEDTYLSMGQHAYRFFEYDSGTSTCTSNEYPKGSGWRVFTLSPKHALQPLEWAVN